MVEFHELGEIELRLLEELNLLDENVLEWEDLFAFLSDFLSNRFGNAKKYNYLYSKGRKHLQFLS